MVISSYSLEFSKYIIIIIIKKIPNALIFYFSIAQYTENVFEFYLASIVCSQVPKPYLNLTLLKKKKCFIQ